MDYIQKIQKLSALTYHESLKASSLKRVDLIEALLLLQKTARPERPSFASQNVKARDIMNSQSQ